MLPLSYFIKQIAMYKIKSLGQSPMPGAEDNLSIKCWRSWPQMPGVCCHEDLGILEAHVILGSRESFVSGVIS